MTSPKKKKLLKPFEEKIILFFDGLKSKQISEVINDKSVDEMIDVLLEIFKTNIFDKCVDFVNGIITMYEDLLKKDGILTSSSTFPRISYDVSTSKYLYPESTTALPPELNTFFNENIFIFYNGVIPQFNLFLTTILPNSKDTLLRTPFATIFNVLNTIHSANEKLKSIYGGSSNNGRISSTITKHNRKNNGGSKNKNKRKTKRHKLNATKKISRR